MAQPYTDLIINVADPTLSGLLVLGKDGQVTQGTARVPKFTRNDGQFLRLRFVKPDATALHQFADVDLTNVTVRAAIGSHDGVPAAGTWYLKSGSTAADAVNYNSTAGALQNALNGALGTNAVTVTKPIDGFYYVTFTATGTQTLLTAVATGLVPLTTITVTRAQTGSSTLQEVQAVQLQQNVYALTTSWTTFSAAAATITQEQTGSSSLVSIQSVTLDPAPYGGTWTLVLPGTGGGTYTNLSWNIAASELQAKIGNNHIVTKPASNKWTFEWRALGSQSAITTTVSTLLVPLGVYGELNLNTTGLMGAFSLTSKKELQAALEIELQWSGQSEPQTVLSVPVIINRDVINPATVTPVTFTAYEPYAGLPSVDGYVWSSTAAGVRGWTVSAGSGLTGGTSGHVITASGATTIVDSGTALTSLQPIINFASAAVIHVSKATAATDTRGSYSKYDAAVPFATLAAAIAVASSGDVIDVGPGTFTVTNIQLPANVSLHGAGIDVTTIQSAALLATGAIVALGTNSVVSDLTVTGTATGQSFQIPIGNYKFVGQADFTGAKLYRVKTVANSDGLYVRPTTASDVRAYDCIFLSTYDAVVVWAGGTIDCYNCYASSLGPSPITGATNSGLVSVTGTLRFFGGGIEVSGNIATSNNGANATSGTIEVWNTRMNVSSGAGGYPAYDLYNANGTVGYSNVARSDGGALVTGGTITQLSRDLSRDSNLSDLVSASTARTNLGLVIGTDVQAYDADLTTWGATTPPSSYAVGDLLYASAANTLSKLADTATGNALLSGGVTTAPTYGKIGLTTHVSGTLAAGNGGTGITSLGTNIATALGNNIAGTTLATLAGSEALTNKTYNGTTPTTAGLAILGVTNPSAISFVKIAADNSVSTRTPAQVLSDILAAPLASPTFTGTVNAATTILTESVGSSALTITGATQTSNFPPLNIAQTWNNSGTVFKGLSLAITNTASAGTSKPVDVLVGGSSIFNVQVGGIVSLLCSGSSYLGLGNGDTLRINGDRIYPSPVSGTINLGSGSTGTIAVSGALTVAGTSTLTGGLIGGVQALSGAGAVNVTTVSTAFTSTGGSQALTLADGTAGQIKTICHVVDGGSGVLTPTTKAGYSTITFTAAGDSVTLQFHTTAGWCVVGSYGVTIA